MSSSLKNMFKLIKSFLNILLTKKKYSAFWLGYE